MLNSTEAEQYVIGALLSGDTPRDIRDGMLSRLDVEHFTSQETAVAFAAIHACVQAGHQPEVLIVAEGCEKRGVEGMLPFLTDILFNSTGSANAGHYCTVLDGYRAGRKAVKLAHEIAERVSSCRGAEVHGIIAETGAQLAALAEAGAQLSTCGYVSLGEALDTPDEATDWLVDGILPADGLSMMVAPPKVGKSTLARCLACCVASGSDFLGRRVRKGRVLHFALEERHATVKAHYRKLDGSRENILLWTDILPEPRQRLAMLRQAIKQTDPALVIIDPLFRFSAIEDGNSYAETMKAMDPFIAVAREGSTHLLLVHHARKGGGDHGAEALGSTGLHASVDTLLSMARENGSRTIYANGRDGVSLEKTMLHLDTTTGWISATGTQREANIDEMCERVLAYLRDQAEPVTRTAIRNGVEGKAERVSAALHKLTQDGTIKLGEPGPRKVQRWVLA